MTLSLFDPYFTDLDFCTGSAGHHFGDFLEIDSASQVHLSAVDLENVGTGLKMKIR